MADRKPIRWAVPRGGESYMGLAQYFLAHEENMRQSFSQPSRRARRTLPDGTTIDYIMNDVVDFISISPPQRIVRAIGKAMTWDKLPPLEEGTNYIDLSQMTEDPDVEGGYYCDVSVINGTDGNGRVLPATFSFRGSVGSAMWTVQPGIRQTDGTYKVDGKSATLLLGANVTGSCNIIAEDGNTRLEKMVSVSENLAFFYLGTDGLYYTVDAITGELQYFMSGKSSEGISASPFGLYGEQSELRHDVIYHTTWYSQTIYTISVVSYVELDEGFYEVVLNNEAVTTVSVVDTNDPLAEGYENATSYQTVAQMHLDQLEGYPVEYSSDGYNFNSSRTQIFTEGGGILSPFLVMQSPVFDGDGVHTRAMKKPGEEVYFVVSYHDNNPTFKTVHWFIDSTSYASYAFSDDLVVESVNMLLDNVYYNSGG